MQNSNSNELSIILPVFNEEGVIKRVISEVRENAISLVDNLEIIAVDDGSKDNSRHILNQLKKDWPELKVIFHQENTGYGGALRSGINVACKKWILLMDSDGQFRSDSLRDWWLKRNMYDVMLGYRQERADAFYRRIMGRVGNLTCNLILGRQVKDINCGFKLFKNEIIKPLALTSQGGIINFEILFKILKKDATLRMGQFPIVHYPRKSGKSTGGNPGVIFKIISEGIKIVFPLKKPARTI